MSMAYSLSDMYFSIIILLLNPFTTTTTSFSESSATHTATVTFNAAISSSHSKGLSFISDYSSNAIDYPSSPPKKGSLGFIAPLIHRSSPLSPFYNPNTTPEDIIRENVRTGAARCRFFSQRDPFSSAKFAQARIIREYAMKYMLGSPSIDTYGIPDTGSDLIWLQCLPCVHCYPQLAFIFNSSKSTSCTSISCASSICQTFREMYCEPYKPGPCEYYVLYMDGSSSQGTILEETFTLMDDGGNPFTLAKRVFFGCGNKNNDTTGTYVPGVVGLGTRNHSLIGQLDFPDFSYCVSNKNIYDGSIRFGTSAILTGYFLDLLPNPFGHYHVKLVGISVGNTRLNISAELFQLGRGDKGKETGFFVDSGTSYTHLCHEAFDELLDGVQEFMDPREADSVDDLELCYNNITGAPTIEFEFGLISYPITQENTWVRRDGSDGKVYCFAFMRSEKLSIFGMYQVRGTNIGFDLTNNGLTLDWAENVC